MKNILEKTIELAIKKGADQADVILNSGSTLSAKSESQEISDYKVNSSQSLGIRIIKNKQVGISYCESFTDDSLNDLVDQSINNSKYSKVEEAEEIQVQRKEELDGTKDFLYSDSRVDPKDLIQKTLKFEADLIKKDKRLKTPPYNSVGEYVVEGQYLNHLGTYCHEKQKIYSAYTSALIEESDKNAMFFQEVRSRDFKDLDFAESIDVSYTHALALLDASPVSTGNYDVVFSKEILPSFMGAFSNLFSARAAIDNLNPFKEKIGEAVASNLITLVDQPHHKDGYSYSVFDSEGNIREDTTIIKDGILNGFYQNSSTSRELGMKNTFNAHRSPKSTLGTSGTHKVILEGATKDQDILKQDHFEVIHLQGLHSGCNNISGDFSFAASGYLYQNGEKVQAVKGVTISGNYFDALKNIKLVGDTQHACSSGSFFAPKVMFGDFSVGGK